MNRELKEQQELRRDPFKKLESDKLDRMKASEEAPRLREIR